MSLFNLTYSYHKYNGFHLLKLLYNQNGTNFHNPCTVSIALLVCCWNMLPDTPNKTLQYYLAWIPFQYFFFFCYFFWLKLSFGNQHRFFFSLILWFDFPSPVLVFQECQLKLLLSFFLFGYSFVFEVQLWGVVWPIQEKSVIGLQIWIHSLWLICRLDKSRVMRSCNLPSSYKMDLMVGSSAWASWWMVNLHESSICLFLVYNYRCIYSIAIASNCNITCRGV